MNTEFKNKQKKLRENNGDQTWMKATAAISSIYEAADTQRDERKDKRLALILGRNSSIS